MNSKRKAEFKDINVLIVDMDVLDTSIEHDLEQGDVEMVDVLDEVFIIDELNPRTIDPEFPDDSCGRVRKLSCGP